MHEVLLFLHIVGAAGWIGGGLFGVYSFSRLAKEGGSGSGRAMEVIFERAGVYFTIMFLLVVGPGVALVLTEDQFGWGDTFVWFGIGAIVLSGIWQGLVAGKSGEKLQEAVKNESPDRLTVYRSWRRTSWVDVAILLVALWAMVTKL